MIVADVVYVQVKNGKNKKRVEEEFDRRRLVMPVNLLPEESVSGSLFFPLAPGPQKLSATFQVDAEMRELEFVLSNTPLAELHLK